MYYQIFNNKKKKVEKVNMFLKVMFYEHYFER